MNYRLVNLGHDYIGTIQDFSAAKNSFLTSLGTDEYALFVEDDEDIPVSLTGLISHLPPLYPYYWIRRVNLFNDRYKPQWNPEYSPKLVSNRARFYGRVHERVTPKDPHGIIDIPIIHNQKTGEASYANKWYQNLPVYYNGWLAVKKIIEVARGR